MRCSHCRASFCWACMQLRTRCRAYQCTNGGRNAVPLLPGGGGTGDVSDATTPTLLTRLDYLEQRRGSLTRRDAGIMLSSLFLRHWWPVQAIANCVGFVTTVFFGSMLARCAIWAYIFLVAVHYWAQEQVRQQAREQVQQQLRQPRNRQRQVGHDAFTFIDNWATQWQERNGGNHNIHNLMAENMAMNMTEEQMLAAAMTNSRRER
jgi:hypothetical protein